MRARAFRGTLRSLLSLAGDVRESDLVLFHRTFLKPKYLAFVRLLGSMILFDFDDLITHQLDGTAVVSSQERFQQMLDSSSAVICGNQFLKTRVPSSTRSLVLPSPVPMEVPRANLAERAGPLRIGWVGLGHNLVYLDELVPTLRDLARSYEIELVLLSDKTMKIDGVRVEHVPWQLETQESVIATFDVGIMPLPSESDFSKGKCAYKVLQYMAAEVPAVATAIGMNLEVIEHGVTGFLASDESGWHVCLETLLSDRELRASVGRAGRRSIERDYSYEAYAAKLAGFLHTVAP